MLQNVVCTSNVQHDCATSGCNAIRQIFERQERQETTKSKDVLDHVPTNAYVLNTHSIHNYKWIAAVTPSAIRNQCKSAFIADHQAVRLHAAKLVREKKAVEGDNPVIVSSTEPNQPPAFARGKQSKGKGRAKNTTKTTTPAATNNASAPGPSYAGPGAIPDHGSGRGHLIQPYSVPPPMQTQPGPLYHPHPQALASQIPHAPSGSSGPTVQPRYNPPSSSTPTHYYQSHSSVLVPQAQPYYSPYWPPYNVTGVPPSMSVPQAGGSSNIPPLPRNTSADSEGRGAPNRFFTTFHTSGT
jgi:hypothetical protein